MSPVSDVPVFIRGLLFAKVAVTAHVADDSQGSTNHGHRLAIL